MWWTKNAKAISALVVVLPLILSFQKLLPISSFTTTMMMRRAISSRDYNAWRRRIKPSQLYVTHQPQSSILFANQYSSSFSYIPSFTTHYDRRLFSALHSTTSDSSSTTTDNETTTTAAAATTEEKEKEADLWRKTQTELMKAETKHAHKYTPYERLVRRLYMTNLFNPVKMGLKNIKQLHTVLGSPMDNPNITLIHVAGTNGKGSVSLKIAKSLELSGHKTGLFVSPHVSSFRERMQVNSQLIPESSVVSLLPKVFDACEEHGIPATFFEITTALAFLHFADSQVDAVVLETGLGGRLDATNVVQSPSVCVITSIGLEHTRILGDTVELIAKEKGGIIKAGRPVLVGPNVPHDVLRQCAKEKGASGYYTCDDVLGTNDDDNACEEGRMLHDYDKENARIAKAALAILEKQRTDDLNEDEQKTDKDEQKTDKSFFQRKLIGSISAEEIEEGTSQRPPCRFEEVSVKIPKDETIKSFSVILDVAHNPPAMEYLVAKLEASYPNKAKRFVAGFSSDKDLAKCGQLLLSSIPGPSNLHVVEASHPRAAKLEAILEAEPLLRQSNFDREDRSITAQVKYALELAVEKDELLVVCGSVFLMAEAREALGFDEPRDSDCMEEVAGSNLKHGQENFGFADGEKDAMKAVLDSSCASNK